LIPNQIKIPQKRELQTNVSGEHRCKNPQQNINKLNPKILKKSFITIKWDLFLGCKTGSVFSNQST